MQCWGGLEANLQDSSISAVSFQIQSSSRFTAFFKEKSEHWKPGPNLMTFNCFIGKSLSSLEQSVQLQNHGTYPPSPSSSIQISFYFAFFFSDPWVFSYPLTEYELNSGKYSIPFTDSVCWLSFPDLQDNVTISGRTVR